MTKPVLKTISILMIFALVNAHGFARDSYIDNSNSDEFYCFNEDEFYQEFSDISDLENHLEVHNQTYTELETAGSELIASIAPSPLTPFSDDSQYSRDPFGISSFLWGCMAGVTGIILVFLLTKSKSEARKAFNGCITQYVLMVAGYVAIMLISSSVSGSNY